MIYSMLGLMVRSDVPLPCLALPTWSGAVDVTLTESTESELEALCVGVPARVDTEGYWRTVVYDSGAAAVSWKNYFDYAASADGSQVRWLRRTVVPDEVLLTYLLGQALSFSLLARGIEPLHATGVLLNGEAIAFLGDSGLGKSTLAAAMLSRGHRLLTDDVLVLRFEHGRAMALPSVARIKLTPESADAVFQGRRATLMNPLTTKMIFPLGRDQHASEAVPLRAMYVIESEAGGGVSIGEPGGRAKFLAVIRHTFNDSLQHPSRVRQQFDFARKLLRIVAIRSLRYPRDMALLPAVADAVLMDVKGVAAG